VLKTYSLVLLSFSLSVVLLQCYMTERFVLRLVIIFFRMQSVLPLAFVFGINGNICILSMVLYRKHMSLCNLVDLYLLYDAGNIFSVILLLTEAECKCSSLFSHVPYSRHVH